MILAKSWWDGTPDFWNYVDLLVGGCFVVVGVIVWRLNRMGPLMVLAGALWLVNTFQVGPLAALAGSTWVAAMAHVVLAVPHGRLTWPSWVLVVAAYTECVTVTAVRRPWLTEAEPGGWFTGLVTSTEQGVTIVLGAGVLVTLVRTWRQSSTIERRALTYVLAPSVLATLVYEVWLPLRESADADFFLRVGIASIPLAYLGSLARRKIDQTSTENVRLTRLERDLHDGVQQRLLSIAMTLGMAESAPNRSKPLVAEAKTAVLAALDEVRAVCNGIHPPILTERGLRCAVEEMTELAPVPTTLSIELPEFVPPAVETVTYYLIAEALTNIGKHADAEQARITIKPTGRTLVVEVCDDGRGGATPAKLAERVEAGGGTMTIISNPGAGTAIRAVLPCG
jgi:signal transduction histidine kinase